MAQREESRVWETFEGKPQRRLPHQRGTLWPCLPFSLWEAQIREEWEREKRKSIHGWIKEYCGQRSFAGTENTSFFLLHVLKVRGRKKREGTFIVCQFYARHSARTFNFTSFKLHRDCSRLFKSLSFHMEKLMSTMVKLPKVTYAAARLDQVCLPAKHSSTLPLRVCDFLDISTGLEIGLATYVLTHWFLGFSGTFKKGQSKHS